MRAWSLLLLLSCRREEALGDPCARAKLGPLGGRLDAGEISLDVPHGALDTEQEVSLCPAPAPRQGEASSRRWTLSEIPLLSPASVTLRYDSDIPHALFVPGRGGDLERSLLASEIAPGYLSGPIYRGGVVLSAPDAREIALYDGPELVDLLFVVDDSCNMADEQARLAAGAPQLFGALSALDFHVGLVSTDIEDPLQQGRLQSVDADGDPATYDEPRYLSSETPAPEALFAEMVALGTDGAVTERGLGAIRLAIEQRETFNAGFLRREASLGVVVVSDEDDQTEAALVSGPELAEILGEASDWPPTLAALVRTGGEHRGSAYISLAETLGGPIGEIGSADWDPFFAELLDQLARPGLYLPAGEPPQVWVIPGGEEEPYQLQDSEIDWDEGKLRVLASVPSESIRILYTP